MISPDHGDEDTQSQDTDTSQLSVNEVLATVSSDSGEPLLGLPWLYLAEEFVSSRQSDLGPQPSHGLSPSDFIIYNH